MDGLVSEKEQIEALRNWWRENGLYIVAGIVLGVVLLIGWRWWEHEQAQSAGEASALYESLVEDVADLRVEAARTKNERMQAEYAKTVYAAQARLAMAKLYMDLGRDRDAARELEALVNADRPADEIALVGRLRLARILMYQDKPEEAAALLEGHGNTAFAARYAEALGDAYTAMGRVEDAREAYLRALAENPQARTVDAALVRMKLNDLPPAGETGSAAEDAGGAAAGEDAAEPAGTEEPAGTPPPSNDPVPEDGE